MPASSTRPSASKALRASPSVRGVFLLMLSAQALFSPLCPHTAPTTPCRRAMNQAMRPWARRPSRRSNSRTISTPPSTRLSTRAPSECAIITPPVPHIIVAGVGRGGCSFPRAQLSVVPRSCRVNAKARGGRRITKPWRGACLRALALRFGARRGYFIDGLALGVGARSTGRLCCHPFAPLDHPPHSPTPPFARASSLAPPPDFATGQVTSTTSAASPSGRRAAPWVTGGTTTRSPPRPISPTRQGSRW